jgi:hypothetical protein
MTIVALDPTSGSPDRAADHQLAARPTSLSGQVLGIVCNMLGDCETFFDHLAEELGALDDYAGVIKVVKPSQSVPPPPEDWERLMGATVAVAGFGGCGSCSARSMRDALELEWAGIPTVYIGHTALVPSAGAIARLSGHPDYPMVLVDYPYPTIATWTDDECRTLAKELAPTIRAGLLATVAADTLVGAPA